MPYRVRFDGGPLGNVHFTMPVKDIRDLPLKINIKRQVPILIHELDGDERSGDAKVPIIYVYNLKQSKQREVETYYEYSHSYIDVEASVIGNAIRNGISERRL